MKAEVIQQRSLLELAELDAERGRIEHRAGHLAESQRLETIQATHREANDRLAVLQIALDDLNEQVSKFEAEIDSVRQREDRDRKLLDSGPQMPSSSPSYSTNWRHSSAGRRRWRTRCWRSWSAARSCRASRLPS